MVRGVKVSFSASSINMHLGLSNCEDALRDFIDIVGTDELNRILGETTIEGTNWLLDRGKGVYLCSRPLLKPIAKIWYHFIRTRLIPNSHIETVSKERLVLLFFILEGREINVGKLIQKEILACAFKHKGYLFFPSLVTNLCLRSGLMYRPLMRFWLIQLLLAKLLSRDSPVKLPNLLLTPMSCHQVQLWHRSASNWIFS